MPELVSVIVPVYNNENTLKRCIESIRNQKYSNIEILLINDGSVDNSIEICKEYEEKDSRVHLYSQKNQGVSSARNLGISKSNGEYIFFIDADDKIEINTLENLIIETNKYDCNKVLVRGNYKIVDGKKDRLCNYGNKIYKKEEIIKEIIGGKVDGAVWNYLFNRELIIGIEFDTNTSYMEDTVFLMRYLKEIESVKYIENKNSFYNYYIDNLKSITNTKERALKNIYDFIYSLNEINRITEEKYKKELIKKEIKLIEKEARNLESIDEYKKFLNNQKIKEILRYQKGYFSRLYSLNNPQILKLYYEIRKIIKNIKNNL